MAFPNLLTNFLVGGGLKLFGFAFYLAQILSGDRSQVGQFKSWIRKKLRFLGHPRHDQSPFLLFDIQIDLK